MNPPPTTVGQATRSPAPLGTAAHAVLHEATPPTEAPASAEPAPVAGPATETATGTGGRTAHSPGPAGRGMRAEAAVETAAGAGGRTVIERLASAPPLTLRQTGPHTVHLISTAAGPLGGDRLRLDLRVAPGTTLELGSVAATLVLPGDGPSMMLITAHVGAEATLRYVPEPTVLAARSDHRLRVRLTLEPGATVLWREEIVFGRHGEPSGRCHARFDATCDGVPLLRQEFTVGDPGLDGSPAVYGSARCVGTTFLTERAPAPAVAEGVAVLPLAAPGTLVSALADDAVQLRARLEWGERQAMPAPPTGDDSVAYGGEAASPGIG
ncbi:urease accessory protein UreD [Nonomuraea fastidiosa]|uniref:urease accessory protein UreD n=1 Tax=Nonomuraea TaxID=83681 RepID=UPI00341587D5